VRRIEFLFKKGGWIFEIIPARFWHIAACRILPAFEKTPQPIRTGHPSVPSVPAIDDGLGTYPVPGSADFAYANRRMSMKEKIL